MEQEGGRKRLHDLTGSSADIAALAAQQALPQQDADPADVDVVGNGWTPPSQPSQPAGTWSSALHASHVPQKIDRAHTGVSSNE